MRAPYQAPALQAAGSFSKVTDGRPGWGRDYYYRNFRYGGHGGHGGCCRWR
jgi:hypothetical protein